MDTSPEDEKLAPTGAMLPVAQAGFQFSGSVLGALGIGWLIDEYFGTGPWGIAGMLFVGLFGGFYTMWHALNGADKNRKS